MIASMRDALAKRDIRFLVAIPPNSSTIYQDDLPIWAQARGQENGIRPLSSGPRRARVKTVDLRPAMNAIRADGDEAYLFYDAHWTARGAMAGFNAVVEADGHPDWRIDPATAIGPPEERKGGDVARILGVQDDVTEKAETFALPPSGKDDSLSQDVMPDSCDHRPARRGRRSW